MIVITSLNALSDETREESLVVSFISVLMRFRENNKNESPSFEVINTQISSREGGRRKKNLI